MIAAIFQTIIRIVQFICSLIVLAISVGLIKEQLLGTVNTHNFGAFIGGFGLLAALVGEISLFVKRVPPIAPLVVDGLAALFSLSAGMAIAIIMRNITCSRKPDMLLKIYKTDLTNFGCVYLKQNKENFCPIQHESNPDQKFEARCMQNKADAAFMFLFFFTTVAAILYNFMLAKRNKDVAENPGPSTGMTEAPRSEMYQPQP